MTFPIDKTSMLRNFASVIIQTLQQQAAQINMYKGMMLGQLGIIGLVDVQPMIHRKDNTLIVGVGWVFKSEEDAKQVLDVIKALLGGSKEEKGQS